MKSEYYILKTGLPENHTSINVVEITADDTYIKPSNLLYARVVCIGGGGGGGSGRVATSTNTMTGGAGGGGGAMAFRVLANSEINPTGETITIGLGGGGAAANVTLGSSNGTAGTDGGNTSFGSLVIADSGKGGAGGSTSATLGGNGGSIFNCTPTIYGLSKNGFKGAYSTRGNGGS